MDACKPGPRPKVLIKLVSAGQSDRRMAFAAQHRDFHFVVSEWVNEPTRPASVPARMPAHVEAIVGSLAAVSSIRDEVATLPGVKAIMLTFDDLFIGMDTHGQRIQPLMRGRAGRWIAA
jgi:hypothetical protein